MAQLELLGIPSQALPMPFCALSLRPHRAVYGKNYVPMLDIGSTAPLNGAYCKPRNPVLTGQEAIPSLQKCNPSHVVSALTTSIRNLSAGYHLCNAALPWAGEWRDLFDSKAGEGAASVRKLWASTFQSECVAKLENLLQSASAYTGPEAEILSP